MVRMGETVVLVTAVMGYEEKPSMGYFPLSVEFEERHYASGQILGSRFARREGKPSDGAVLSARIIDRTIRPLFNHAIRNEVQVVATVLAMGEDDPDVLSVIGASLALGVSDIPWDGPIGAARIGMRTDTGAVVVNPTYLEREAGVLTYEVLACGKDSAINMIETSGFEISESEIITALERVVTINTTLETFQKNIIAEIGKVKRDISVAVASPELRELFGAHMKEKLETTLFSKKSGSHSSAPRLKILTRT
jgi:polyribonucleotide nucleotidyltransferase